MKEILQAALSKTQLQSSRGVEQILRKKLPSTQIPEHLSQVWTLDSYGLEALPCLQAASDQQQQELRSLLARDRFLEAYQIEKAGMSFAAKMSLLAESLSEQKLFSLFAAEEASHFHMIEAVLGAPPAEELSPFIELLQEIIRSAERRSLIFIIQVVLEGWGLDHYALMKRTCQDPALSDYLQRILLDEAAHHGSGLSLFNESDLTPAEFDYIREMLQSFLNMVRIGPVGMIQALESVLGPQTETQKSEMLEQMQARRDTIRKLNLLRELMAKAGAHKILASLEAAQSFSLLF